MIDHDSTLVKRNWFEKRCQHNKFIIDPSSADVECGLCGEKLNPIWVLEQYCNKESRARNYLTFLEEQAEKAQKKNRCKCEHCGKMTNIQK